VFNNKLIALIVAAFTYSSGLVQEPPLEKGANIVAYGRQLVNFTKVKPALAYSVYKTKSQQSFMRTSCWYASTNEPDL
jgi:hypothetical protein